MMSIMVFSLLSCDDFLDEKPDSDITEDNYVDPDAGDNDTLKYTTATQAEQLISGAYKRFESEFWQLDMYIMNESQSDNSYAGEEKEDPLQIDRLRIKPTNETVKRDWGYVYTHLSDINEIIAWVPQIPDPALTSTRKNEIVGEASFMRALCYFNLVRIFGSVPLIVQDIPEINLDNLDEVYPLIYPENASIEDIYVQIVKDLEYALANVPDYSAFKFKVTKAVVNLTLAQVYATKDGFENTDWGKVKGYVSAVVSDTRYGLLDNFDDLFAVSEPFNGTLPNVDLINEHSKESLFEIDFNSWTTMGNWGSQMLVGTDWKKFNTPSHDLYDAFTNAGDVVRRDASILFYDVTGAWTDFYWPSDNYPLCWKNRAQEKNNVILFRYAEALLLLAEAENELGNISESQRLLNLVRNRARLGNTTANTKEALRLAIENENRFEFAFEGKRWFDLKRRGRFITVMSNTTDHQKQYGSAMAEYQLVWPIPQNELDLNENLNQNPGY
jgi:hypothetical protein